MIEALGRGFMIGIFIMMFCVEAKVCNPKIIRLYFLWFQIATLGQPAISAEDYDRHCQRHPEG